MNGKMTTMWDHTEQSVASAADAENVADAQAAYDRAMGVADRNMAAVRAAAGAKADPFAAISGWPYR